MVESVPGLFLFHKLKSGISTEEKLQSSSQLHYVMNTESTSILSLINLAALPP